MASLAKILSLVYIDGTIPLGRAVMFGACVTLEQAVTT